MYILLISYPTFGPLCTFYRKNSAFLMLYLIIHTFMLASLFWRVKPGSAYKRVSRSQLRIVMSNSVSTQHEQKYNSMKLVGPRAAFQLPASGSETRSAQTQSPSTHTRFITIVRVQHTLCFGPLEPRAHCMTAASVWRKFLLNTEIFVSSTIIFSYGGKNQAVWLKQ
jgi:hypothetical protein